MVEFFDDKEKKYGYRRLWELFIPVTNLIDFAKACGY